MIKTKNLPATAGVYLFKIKKTILYIGKSVNIKARVNSHLQNAKISAKEAAIVSQSDRLDYIVTDSEFKALLLEAQLIRRYRPKYNIIWKDNKSYLYIKITVKEKFPKVLVVRRENDRRSLYFGPFSSRKVIEEVLSEIRRVIPFCTQPRLSQKACFYAKINLCNPCPNIIKTKKELLLYRHNIRQVVQILAGRTDVVSKRLLGQIVFFSNRENYEEALKYRNKLRILDKLIYRSHYSETENLIYNQSQKALDQLKSMLAADADFERIECYDVSNLAQKQATGSMVVFSRGLADRGNYRRFKIRIRSGASDMSMLKQVIARRFQRPWPKPGLIVVDGGKPQLKAVRSVIKRCAPQTRLIGLAKNPDRLIIDGTTVRPKSDNFGFQLLRQIRDESHRFAKKYHLFLRRRSML